MGGQNLPTLCQWRIFRGVPKRFVGHGDCTLLTRSEAQATAPRQSEARALKGETVGFFIQPPLEPPRCFAVDSVSSDRRETRQFIQRPVVQFAGYADDEESPFAAFGRKA